jgi:hypothetical protein
MGEDATVRDCRGIGWTRVIVGIIDYSVSCECGGGRGNGGKMGRKEVKVEKRRSK